MTPGYAPGPTLRRSPFTGPLLGDRGVHLRVGVADLAHQLARVLADDEGRAVCAAGRLGERVEEADLVEAPDEGMLVGDREPALLRLRVVVEAQGEARILDLDRDARGVERGEPVGGGLR